MLEFLFTPAQTNFMSLQTELKLITQSLHQQVEQHELFRKILLKTITYGEYILLLKILYGFWLPLENDFSQLKLKNFPWPPITKHLLLHQDLALLGINLSSIASLPHCTSLPSIKNQATLLGCLYVMEGSLLGGQVIARLLNKVLALKQHNGCAFFYGYGSKTYEYWQVFCRYLNGVSLAYEKQEVIDTALQTFSLFSNWINNYPSKLKCHFN